MHVRDQTPGDFFFQIGMGQRILLSFLPGSQEGPAGVIGEIKRAVFFLLKVLPGDAP